MLALALAPLVHIPGATADPPTAFNPLYLSTGSSQTFTITGGSKLNLGPGSDAAAVVESKNTCTAASGSGSLEAKDLGPNDDGGATEATAVVTVKKAGTYKVCYKLNGGTYSRVGGELLTFSATAPTSFTPTKWTPGKLGWFPVLSPQCLNANWAFLLN